MKRLALLLCCPAILAFGADLASVKNVYLLKMSKGMDQFLANRLTSEHVFLIVTDPKLADAILTDQIGEGFESKFNELYPPPPPPPEPVATPAKTEKQEKAEKGAPASKPVPKTEDSESTMAMFSEAANKLPLLTSAFGRGKGTLFLVDTKSKEVLWSTFELPRDASSHQLDRTANDIVSRLKHDLKRK
jgi:hypothetical protein